MPQQSMTEFVNDLERAGMLVRVSGETNVNDLPRVMEDHPTTAVLVENIKDCEFQFLANAYSNQDMYAWALECDKTQTGLKIVDRAKGRIKPEIIDTAPCKEVILKGDDVDLTKFPLFLHHDGIEARPVRRARHVKILLCRRAEHAPVHSPIRNISLGTLADHEVVVAVGVSIAIVMQEQRKLRQVDIVTLEDDLLAGRRVDDLGFDPPLRSIDNLETCLGLVALQGPGVHVLIRVSVRQKLELAVFDVLDQHGCGRMILHHPGKVINIRLTADADEHSRPLQVVHELGHTLLGHQPCCLSVDDYAGFLSRTERRPALAKGRRGLPSLDVLLKLVHQRTPERVALAKTSRGIRPASMRELE